MARRAAAPAQAKTWGGSGTATTLVVYDSTNSWGYLGQLYGIAAGNLASHFGKVTAEPVANYVSGQVNNYTATIYIGDLQQIVAGIKALGYTFVSPTSLPG